MKSHAFALLGLAPLLVAPLAWAGRPLATDDAATADAGTCQVETWVERDRDSRALVLSPACGLAPGIEVGADYTRPDPRDTVRAEAGLALKWAPEAARTSTALGELGFGIKAALGGEQPTDAGWRTATTGLLGLASLDIGEAWSVHANLGPVRDRIGGLSAWLYNAAVVWRPQEALLLFAEAQANSRHEVFGGTTTALGARWWLVKDRLGLDLTAARESGSSAGTRFSVGLGAYGFRF